MAAFLLFVPLIHCALGFSTRQVLPKYPSDSPLRISCKVLPDTARPQAADSRLRGGALEWFENAGVSGEMRVQCLLAGVLVLALILELAQL
ncbi:hypothetical protein, partial [Pseudomonas savastanoi]